MGRGALVFKGDAPKKKKSKKKHDKKSDEKHVSTITAQGSAVVQSSTPAAVSSSVATVASKQPMDPQNLLKEGTGAITTSGTVVTGHGTRFDKQLANGDAIIVTIDGQQEMRVVTMRLSQVSCAISSAFSTNLKKPTPFFVIQKPRDVARETKRAKEQAVLDQKEEEKKAFGTYGNTNELVYRETTEHGSYRIKRVALEGDQAVTRGDLLSMRTKKKSDKYC